MASNEEAKPASISELVSYWRVQESLLQSYRRLFLTLETILLSVAALAVSSSSNGIALGVVLVSTLLIGAVAAYLILPIIQTRGEVVFYWQAKLLLAEKGVPIYMPLREMKEFQKNENHEFRNNEEYHSLSEGNNLTRNKLNIYLPAIILFAWVAIVVAYASRQL